MRVRWSVGYVVLCSLAAAGTFAHEPARQDWQTFGQHVRNIALSPDGRTLAVVGPEGGILLLDRKSGKVLARNRQGPGAGSPLSFSPEGKFAAGQTLYAPPEPGGGGSARNTLFLYDAKALTLKKRLVFAEGQGVPGRDVPFVDRKTVAVAGTDEVAALYDIETGKQTGIFAGKGPTRKMAVSRDGRWLLTASNDHKLQLWDVRKRKLVHDLYDHTSMVRAVAISPDGKWCASATFDRRVWVFDREKGTLKARTPTFHKNVYTLLFTPDGKTLIAAGNGPGGGLALWDWQTDREIRGGYSAPGFPNGRPEDRKKGPGLIYSLALTADGRTLYAGGSVLDPEKFRKEKLRGAIHVFDLEALKPKKGAKGNKP
jgi:WD40 repeat protein